MPSILDREVTSPDADAFGHLHFANALQSIVESDKNRPPFSVGLLGKWGTGKSSIKEIYLSSLRDDRNKDSNGKIRSQRFYPITFNAWRFGGANIKRALLRHVFLSLEGDESTINDALFRQIERTMPERRRWSNILRDALDRWVWSLLQVTAVFGLVVLALFLIQEALYISSDWAKAAIAAPLGLSGAAAIRYLLDPKRFVVPLYSNTTRIDLPHGSAEQYEDLLLCQLKRYKQGKTNSGKGKDRERIIVFVDDLDRLPAEEMIEGLDAIRTFMQLPIEEMPEGLGLVFVVSADETRIAEPLASRANRPDHPRAIFDQADARRYLDRIFQFRLEIPSFPKRDVRDYAWRMLEEEAPGVLQDLTDRGVSVETLIDRMIHIDVQSPRSALQILNAFIQGWWLACRREREGAGTEVHGGLHEGAVTDHPISLGALCSIKVTFPKFYADLQADPQLIYRFTDIFIRGLPPDELPEETRTILEGYGNLDSRELYPEHSSLRQFIASLQGHRWPPSIQPLLLLSQDPVTRRLGDGFISMQNAFVSGDTQGVLSQLGRHRDTEPLAPNEIRQLRSLQEDLNNETVSRRNNAYRVIADLASRVPGEDAAMLMDPLAREIAASPELRWQIGVERLRSVLEHATPGSRRGVASSLISNLMKLDGEIAWRLPSGEPPSLDEAIEVVREACPLILWIRAEDGLDSEHDRSFLDWLETRYISAGDRTHNLPFAYLDRWVGSYEESLLADLNGRYTEMVAAQLQVDDLTGIDGEGIIRRSREVFDRLWRAGEDSRPELWRQLNSFVSVKMPEAVQLAWETMNQYQDSPDTVSITAFLSRLADRLSTVMGDEDSQNRSLDWEAGGSALLSILDARGEDLGSEADESLIGLGQMWSENVDTAHFSARLVDILQGAHSEASVRLVNAWIPRLLKDLPDPCMEWLAHNFLTKLDEPQREEVLSQMLEVCQRDDVSEGEGSRYTRFIALISREVLESSKVQEHISQLYAQVAARHQNPNSYLFRLFPAVVTLLDYASPSDTGQMLHSLFSNASGNPELYGWLHSQMAGHWPRPLGALGPYNPENIFSQATTIIERDPQSDYSTDLLYSITRMAQLEVVAEEDIGQVLDAAVNVWPHHPEDSLRTIEAFQQVPGPEQVASLADGTPVEDDEALERLSRAWSHLAPRMSDDARLATTKSILAVPAARTEDDGDILARVWVDALAEFKDKLLSSIFGDEDLNDSQLHRIWVQAQRLSAELDREFFISILPGVLTRSGFPQTVRAALDSRDRIDLLFASSSDRHALGEALIRAFLASPSVEVKNRIADWVEDIGATAVVNDLEKYGEPTEEDVTILKDRIPSSARSLERILKRMEDAKGDE